MKPEELKEYLRGLVVIMMTPFKENFDLDEEGLKSNTNFLIEKGVKKGFGVLVPIGSMGESPNLTYEERKRTIKAVVEAADGRVPVVPGCQHHSTKAAIKLSKYAEDVGADGVMITAPYYFRHTEDEVFQHFKAINDAIGIGIMVYNNVELAGIDLSVDFLAKLAELENIVGLKECSGDLTKFYLLKRRLRGRLSIISCWAEFLEPHSRAYGMRGFISNIANYAPEIPLNIYKASLKGDYGEGLKIVQRIEPLLNFYSSRDRPLKEVSIGKTAMSLLDLPAGPVRSPLPSLSEEEKEELKEILLEVGILKP